MKTALIIFWKLPMKNMKEPLAACYTEKMRYFKSAVFP